MSELLLTDARYAALAARDAAADGAFVYAVASTGIACRPSCPAPTPRRDRVRVFETVADALAAGFRPCRRCRPDGAPSEMDAAVDRVRTHIDAALAADPDARLRLADLAAVAGASPGAVQRAFTRRVGLSPRAYVDARRVETARAALREGATVLEATVAAGFGSATALYARTDTALGVTPGTQRRGGDGLTVRYALFDTALGAVLVAATDRGVCAVTLGDAPEPLVDALHADFRAATLVRDDAGLAAWAEPVLRLVAGAPGHARSDIARALDRLPLDVRGTAFQRRVWDVLRTIPIGETRTYGELAAAIGQPTATRAVAQACGANPVALVVPCHRVVAAGGGLGGYRWHPDRKRRLLDLESA